MISYNVDKTDGLNMITLVEKRYRGELSVEELEFMQAFDYFYNHPEADICNLQKMVSSGWEKYILNVYIQNAEKPKRVEVKYEYQDLLDA